MIANADRSDESRTVEVAMRTLGREPAMRGKARGIVLHIGAGTSTIARALQQHGWYGRALSFETSLDLDSALKRAGVEAHDVSLIWMDVDGHEAHCLRDASAIVAAGMPVVMKVWPEGLSRAGTSRDDFLTLTRRAFTRAIQILDAGTLPMSIAQVGTLYDALERSRSTATLLFLREGR